MSLFSMTNLNIYLPHTRELERMRDRFVEELTAAKRGAPSSLSYIKNTAPRKAFVEPGARYQVLVVGGTDYKTAIMPAAGKEEKLIDPTKGPVPLFSTAKDFFEFIIRLLDPHINTLAVNFAFPIISQVRDGFLDGTLVKGVKDHRFGSLIGKQVGLETETYIQTEKQRRVRVILANDAVCLALLAPAGAIVGSGLNMAFQEDQNTIVNIESGDFKGFTPTETGRAVDARSDDPGVHMAEKETAGKYLYRHLNVLKNSPDLVTGELTSTRELDTLARTQESPESLAARALFIRSAQLIATQIAGLYVFNGKKPLPMVIDGSVFWKAYKYKETVEDTLLSLGIPPEGVTFIHVEDAALHGAARLAYPIQ